MISRTVAVCHGLFVICLVCKTLATHVIAETTAAQILSVSEVSMSFSPFMRKVRHQRTQWVAVCWVWGREELWHTTQLVSHWDGELADLGSGESNSWMTLESHQWERHQLFVRQWLWEAPDCFKTARWPALGREHLTQHCHLLLSKLQFREASPVTFCSLTFWQIRCVFLNALLTQCKSSSPRLSFTAKRKVSVSLSSLPQCSSGVC